MLELVPALDKLAGQLQLPHAGAFLTLAGLRPFFAGCSQVGGGGILLRNYDFDPNGVDGVISRSNLLRPVIGMQDCGWGLLDGMNNAGLAASLTFGGRFVSGPAFSVLIVVRYLLETCEPSPRCSRKLASDDDSSLGSATHLADVVGLVLGAKLGADRARYRATPGAFRRLSPQVNATSGPAQHRRETV